MAGHSKWANIKHRKERSDAKKGKIFSRCAKEIISAVKMGGPDPKSNSRLRLSIDKARAENVPNDVIDRNIKKASSADQADYIEMTYELYGHGGVGIVVDVLTDNRNRISSEIRIATNKRGGSVASPGSVSYNFDRKGIIQVSSDNVDEEALFQAALEGGAEEFENGEGVYMITTDPTDLYQVKEAIEKKGYKCQSASLEMIPKSSVAVDKETAEANNALIEWLEDIDDVDVVYHNMDVEE
jgi:YebC/PmpR family DNA-binding regulatory protein